MVLTGSDCFDPTREPGDIDWGSAGDEGGRGCDPELPGRIVARAFDAASACDHTHITRPRGDCVDPTREASDVDGSGDVRGLAFDPTRACQPADTTEAQGDRGDPTFEPGD